MTEPYLIAHLVRGEASFDIATRIECSVCNGTEVKEVGIHSGEPCDCTGGYWWMVHGQRAYPFSEWNLNELYWAPDSVDPKIPITDVSTSIMNKDHSGWPDFYTSSEPSRSASTPSTDILSALGLRKPEAPLTRRSFK